MCAIYQLAQTTERYRYGRKMTERMDITESYIHQYQRIRLDEMICDAMMNYHDVIMIDVMCS